MSLFLVHRGGKSLKPIEGCRSNRKARGDSTYRHVDLFKFNSFRIGSARVTQRRKTRGNLTGCSILRANFFTYDRRANVTCSGLGEQRVALLSFFLGSLYGSVPR
jgi:hypothetical protein